MVQSPFPARSSVQSDRVWSFILPFIPFMLHLSVCQDSTSMSPSLSQNIFALPQPLIFRCPGLSVRSVADRLSYKDDILTTTSQMVSVELWTFGCRLTLERAFEGGFTWSRSQIIGSVRRSYLVMQVILSMPIPLFFCP